MEHIDQNIDIDLIDPVINVAYCNQYENASRRIICHVLKGGEAYNIPSDMPVYLRIHKANHYNLYENVRNIGKIEGSTIIIPLMPELTKSYGRHECIFEFMDTPKEKLLYSTKFYIRVAKSPIQNEDVQDSHEYTALVDFINTKGKADGIASLDENGKVPESQLPSYVDDVIEGYLSDENFYKEPEHTTLLSSETGKIYVDLHTDKIYRWSDNAFTIISKDTDTKNTAGATADSDKLFLIGAKEQTDNPQTYSKDTAYIGEDGCIYSGGNKVLTEHPAITLDKDSVSTASPSSGETFTAIDNVTRDTNGHVTSVNTKTITLPSTSIAVDSALSTTSTNPVQNKIVNAAISGKQNYYDRFFRTGSFTIPTGGNYKLYEFQYTGLTVGNIYTLIYKADFSKTSGTDSSSSTSNTGYEVLDTISDNIYLIKATSDTMNWTFSIGGRGNAVWAYTIGIALF